MADIDAFVEAQASSLIAELSAWCAIPSVSTDPACAPAVRRSAEHLAELMEMAGLHAEILAVDGAQPAVYAEWLGAGGGSPTITVHGHHDVWAAGPLEQWTTPPFEPTVRDGCLYARGASDDKGQIHLQLAALRHLLAADGSLPVNLKFLVEGEGEAGSPNLGALLAEHGDRLACDLIVVAGCGSGRERALREALVASCADLGVMAPEDRIHAPDERIDLTNYFNGVRAAACAYQQLTCRGVAEALLAARRR